MSSRHRYADTPAGRVLLTGSRSEAAAFAAQGGCVIGLCPEEELRSIEFPEAAALASEDGKGLTEAFIRKTACHHYGFPFTVAQTDRLVIRESCGEDYPAIFAMLRGYEGCPGPQRRTGQEMVPGQEKGAARKTGLGSGRGDESGAAQKPGKETEEGQGFQVFADGFDLAQIGTEEKFLQYARACYRFFGFGVWTVLLRRTGAVAGWCGLFPGKDEGEEGFHIELGYVIAPSCRRQGYGYEACRAILDYAREEIGLASIILKTDAANAASVSLAKKLGFKAGPAAEGLSSAGTPERVIVTFHLEPG